MRTIRIKTLVASSPIIFPRSAAAFLALVIVVFSIIPLTARLMALPGDGIRQALLDNSETVTPAQLAFLDQNRARVLQLFKRAEFYNDRALAAMEGARLAQLNKAPAPEVLRLYQGAENWQIFALRRAPADPFGWYRMTYLYYLKQGPSPAAAKLWNLSMLTGPYDAQLSMPRLQLGISLGALLGPQGNNLMAKLARDAFMDFPYGLPELAKQGYFISVVEDALQNDPKALETFRERVK